MITYNHLNEHLKNKFGERTLKICVDGSFTCPNRDGKKGKGGCIFCSSRGSGDELNETLPIKEQVASFLSSYRGERANKFIVYFQNFTNTYAPIEELKRKYDEALIDERIVGLEIGTRADCINEEICLLISSYKKKYYVAVELGLQTSNQATHDFINQKITNEEFIKACLLLNKYDIDIIIHIMVGLPNETHEDIKNTVSFLNKLKYAGLKIHSTYIVKNTFLEYLYKQGKYIPLTFEEYVEEVLYILEHIDKNIIIHRINGDPPKNIFVAPEWVLHKKRVMNYIENTMKKQNITQGILYK